MKVSKIVLDAAVVLLALILLGGVATAQELKPIALPAPQTKGGKPLMEALALRSTSRAFASDELPAQTLSNLLWAAWGINRPKEGKRTAPSASNWQEIDVYVVMSSGAYVYDALTNTLKPVVSGDYRALTGKQPFVKDAPVTLVFVADAARMKPGDLSEPIKWADTAFISQNVYLFAASENLATGVRANIDRPALAKALKLDADQSITLAQCVGFPKK
jgi:SagB-type dehydrogenase family enzyme